MSNSIVHARRLGTSVRPLTQDPRGREDPYVRTFKSHGMSRQPCPDTIPGLFPAFTLPRTGHQLVDSDSGHQIWQPSSRTRRLSLNKPPSASSLSLTCGCLGRLYKRPRRPSREALAPLDASDSQTRDRPCPASIRCGPAGVATTNSFWSTAPGGRTMTSKYQTPG